MIKSILEELLSEKKNHLIKRMNNLYSEYGGKK